jgi:hypothetical protein
MSQAASQASIFFEQVARERRVFTFLGGGNHIALPTREGEVMPCWSSHPRMLRIQKQHAKYKSFAIDELSLDAFLDELLPRLEAEKVRIGANWSGTRLVGYDYAPEEVRRNLSYWLETFGRRA